MTGIIVVLPKIEDAKVIRNLLVKNGYTVNAVCSSGAQAMSHIEEAGVGVIISGYKLADMMYAELNESLPSGVSMLLLASQKHLAEIDTRQIQCLSMPFKGQELLRTVEDMVAACERRRKKLREKPRERSPEEMALMREAKELLMARKGMTEMEAHKYLQKCSMDSGTNMVESAQMILAMYRDA